MIRTRRTSTLILTLGALLALPALAASSKGGVAAKSAAPAATPERLRALAHQYYTWRNEQSPVGSSDQGLHTWDDRLGDFSAKALAGRRQGVARFLGEVKGMKTAAWSRDDQVDHLLFRSDLERDAFYYRVLRFEETNPQVYVGECTNAIYSLLKKDYAAPRTRALAATARLAAMPALLEQAKKNLTAPVRLYARLTIDSARAIDPLFTQSLMTLAVGLSPEEQTGLVTARDNALKALHGFADWLEARLPKMVAFKPMGETNYDYYLKHVYLLPLDATQVAMLGEAEMVRYRGLESLLKDPSLASPDPARAAHIPADQEEFLKAYESREGEMIDFLKANHLVTFPPNLGPFTIRQLPEAFKPTAPGGFMNPPGLYDKDNGGFFLIPTYNPKSGNFYIRAAIEDPRPILGHEGIPGHFFQISIANALTNEIRREHQDGIFVEGWALYTEEMLMRRGLYPDNSAAQGQVLRLSRYRGARIGVDVNLHTGRWTFDQAVQYFMDGGGLDREAAEGEAAGAASSPTQKINYIVGKWQIMRLLGKYRDQKGKDFDLGKFHDELLQYGSLPLSVIEWLLLGDKSALDTATR